MRIANCLWVTIAASILTSACRTNRSTDGTQLKDVLVAGYPKIITNTEELTFKFNTKLYDGEPKQFEKAGFRPEQNCFQIGRYENRDSYLVISDGPCPESRLAHSARFIFALSPSTLGTQQQNVNMATARGWVQVASFAANVVFGLCSSVSGAGEDRQFITGRNCDVEIDSKAGALTKITLKAKAVVSIPAPTPATPVSEPAPATPSSTKDESFGRP